ncbi:MAG: alkaline phosphatase family protein [bacterium]
MKEKVFVIGIDGGTFEVIQLLIKEGKLPNISRIIDNGVSGELISTTPPVTAPAWVSFMTGKNPGKHGIFNFLGESHKNYKGRLLTSVDIKTTTLWSILSIAGKKMVLVNIPNIYPPFPVNGVMISGMGTPSKESTFTYPTDIYEKLVSNIGDYVVDYWDNKHFNKDKRNAEFYEEIIKKMDYMTDKRRDAIFYLIREFEWDIFMVVFVLIDRLQHFFWRFIDKTHPEYDEILSKRFGNAISKGYQKIDKIIGEILDEVGEDTTVIVLSDHGFGPLHKFFYINKWLIEKGLLKIKKTIPWRLRISYPNIGKVLSRLKLHKFIHLLPEGICKFSIPRLKIVPKDWPELVDWKKTKAYAFDEIGININMAGREPNGTVQPEEYHKLIEYISDELLKLEDTETGKRIVEKIQKKEDVFTGPFMKEANDLIVLLDHLIYQSHITFKDYFTNKSLFSKPTTGWNGTHRFEGILMMMGHDIKKGYKMKKHEIVDICPTILYLTGLPILSDMDGRVIEDAIQPQKLSSTYITMVEDVNGIVNTKTTHRDSVAKEEENLIQEHLKGLGYL